MSPFSRAAFAAGLLVGVSPGAALAQNSPIQHVIVVVGENHTLDNLFGGYLPPPGQTVHNMLSQDIIDDKRETGS
jgi:phospholipase C